MRVQGLGFRYPGAGRGRLGDPDSFRRVVSVNDHYDFVVLLLTVARIWRQLVKQKKWQLARIAGWIGRRLARQGASWVDRAAVGRICWQLAKDRAAVGRIWWQLAEQGGFWQDRATVCRTSGATSSMSVASAPFPRSDRARSRAPRAIRCASRLWASAAPSLAWCGRQGMVTC